MVIVLAGIVVVIGAALVVDSARLYGAGRDITDIAWQGRVALERMERELRAISSTAGITTWTAGTLAFTDTGGTSINYSLGGGSVQRIQGASPSQPLADNVSSLAFSYWDRSGVEVVPGVGSVSSIYYVTVTFGIAKGDFNGTYRTTVHPESF